MAAPQIREPAAGAIGSSPLEAATEDGRAGIADRRDHGCDLRGELLAKPIERLDADDQTDAGHPGLNTEQFSRGRGLVPDNGKGQQKGEDWRRRIENGGESGVERAFGPGNQREWNDAVEAGLKQKPPPGRDIPRQMDPRQRMIGISNRPAISVRAAIKVMGGMVATPSLMKI
jgi:hypothetical protein